MSGPISRILQTGKRVLTALAPTIIKLYEDINAGRDEESTSRVKRDDSLVTVADYLVQHVLCTVFEKFEIVGEEELKSVHLDSTPFKLNGLEIPEDAEALLRVALKEISQIDTSDLDDDDEYVLFIDPIDGTKEFGSGKGLESTCLLGVSHNGRSVGGLIFRPLSGDFAAGSLIEDFKECNVTSRKEIQEDALLTTNSDLVSPFLNEFLIASDFKRFRSGGAGNKCLLLLELGPKALYAQDRGLSRWDTCAPSAVLEAFGGRLIKLSTLLDGDVLEEYEYTKEWKPPARLPKTFEFTKRNSIKRRRGGGGEDVLPYSNVDGMLATLKKPEEILAIAKTMRDLKTPPTYT